MNPDNYQQLVDQFQEMINDTQQTLDRFEATGMDEQLPDDYDKLLDILDDAVKQQREYVMVALR